MNNIKDNDNRKYIIGSVAIGVAVVFLISLLNLQVIDKSARLSADDIVIRTHIMYPSRGKIYDRKGKLMVYNKAAYDLMVVPNKLKSFDTLTLCKAVNIDQEELIRGIDKARVYSGYIPTVLISQLSAKEFAYLQEILYRFPGFYVQQRTIRAYNYKSAAQVLGYLGEVTPKTVESDSYYKSGDYTGISGIERTYETVLRGEKGQRLVLVDNHGREQDSYKNGQFDIAPVAGKDLTISLDIELQEYAEKLMQNKIGSIVAIEPSTGEILAMVSAPTFDPTTMTGRTRSAAFHDLNIDSLNPLTNRAIQGTYSPGSTFKMVIGATAFQEHAINKFTKFSCNGPESRPIRCTHHHVSPLGVVTAIETSCNPFFYKTFYQTIERPTLEGVKAAYAKWEGHIRSFGFGSKLGVDLPYEYSGSVPAGALYDKIYRKVWRANTVRSLAIGQGELLVTPIQIANEAAILANSGSFYTPHVVKAIGEDKTLLPQYTDLHHTSIDEENFELIREGMRQVYAGNIGTARYYRNNSIEMAGKTGTVENPHGDDHSVFLAFAPFDKPKIAICTIVEMSGFGSRWAAPISTLIMEKYLSDSIPPRHKSIEKDLIKTNLLHHEP